MNFTISGATPVKSFDHAGTLLARFFFVQDPDGYKIEAAVPSRSAGTLSSTSPVWPARCLAALSTIWEAVEKWMKPSAASWEEPG